MMKSVAAFVLTTLIAGAGAAHADEILVDRVAAIEAAQADHPPRGASMNRVLEAHGEPRESSQAVGEPPITRWRYQGFTVYFEHDRVIHSVARR